MDPVAHKYRLFILHELVKEQTDQEAELRDLNRELEETDSTKIPKQEALGGS